MEAHRDVRVAAGRAHPDVHRHKARTPHDPTQTGNTVYSGNWSGQLLLNNVTSYGPSSFYQITGDFTVPTVSQAFGTCTVGTDWASLWVGVDGWGSPDVMQAGVDAEAYCGSGYQSQTYFAWYE